MKDVKFVESALKPETITPKAAAVLLLTILIMGVSAIPLTFAQFTDVRVVGEGDTPREFFEPGDLVEIRGTAPDPTGFVGVQVTNPQGTPILITTIRPAADGTFLKDFRLPTDAAEGEYTVSLTQGEFTATATFQVGPAAPPPPPPAAPPTTATIRVVSQTPSSVQPGDPVTFVVEVSGGDPGEISQVTIDWSITGFAPPTPTGFTEISPPDRTPQRYTIVVVTPAGLDVQLGSRTSLPFLWQAHAVVDGQDIFTDRQTIDFVPTAEKVFSALDTRLAGVDSRLRSLEESVPATVSELQRSIESLEASNARLSAQLEAQGNSIQQTLDFATEIRDFSATLSQDVAAIKADVEALKATAAQPPIDPGAVAAAFSIAIVALILGAVGMVLGITRRG